MNTTTLSHHIKPEEDVDDWRKEAECLNEDPSIFFPDVDSEEAPDYSEARKICNRCSVSSECLEAAMEEEEIYGMWGGKTPAERHLLKSFRKATSLNASI